MIRAGPDKGDDTWGKGQVSLFTLTVCEGLRRCSGAIAGCAARECAVMQECVTSRHMHMLRSDGEAGDLQNEQAKTVEQRCGLPHLL